MNYFEWIITFFGFQIIHFLGTFNLYIKAGRKSWEALIPIYNAIVLTRIIRKPWWWVILLFFPVVNVITIAVFWVLLISVFGKTERKHTFITVLTFGGYIFYLNYSKDVQYLGVEKNQKEKVSFFGSIVFAVIVATLVHNYTIQPYVIPTSSLEKTLLVGDFLFVSKFHYGARVPMTTVSFPMVHDQLPLLGGKSYFNFPQLPYLRLPGFQKVKRNEIVVFNWPADTVRFLGDRSGVYVHKPLDKRTNYVKRCVGIAGDTIQAIDGVLWVNGKKAAYPDRAKLQTSYTVKATSGFFRRKILKAKYGITDPVVRLGPMTGIVNLTQKTYKKMKQDPKILLIKENILPAEKGYAFPQSPEIKWSRDNMGPILIPKQGTQITLNKKTLALYKRCIEEYEGNTIKIKDSQYFINGLETTTYTFKQDYYWMMGDNRHNSEDSRYWGFVPFDHIVGKPIFIWMSIDGINDGIQNFRIRWNRLFTTIHEEGEPVSYFKHFLVGIALFYTGRFFYRRKKQKNNS
jgi:signal peptidase I